MAGDTLPQGYDRPEQLGHVFADMQERTGEESNLTAWAPAVDVYKTENELVIKADLPEVNTQDLDIRVANEILTIRGERKFENKVNEENYLRVERAYGSFTRSFSLANSVKSERSKPTIRMAPLRYTSPRARRRSRSRSRSTSMSMRKSPQWLRQLALAKVNPDQDRGARAGDMACRSVAFKPIRSSISV